MVGGGSLFYVYGCFDSMCLCSIHMKYVHNPEGTTSTDTRVTQLIATMLANVNQTRNLQKIKHRTVSLVLILVICKLNECMYMLSHLHLNSTVSHCLDICMV